MWKLVQSGLSVVAGTAEPEYGPGSIHPVGSDLKEGEPIYSPLSIEDMSYQNPNHTCVETQTFYFSDDTYSGLAQIIHSNIVGLHTTAQFTFKLFKKTHPDDFVWTSTKLENFSNDKASFYADNVAVELSQTLDTYTVKSSVTSESIVDLTFERVGDGIKFGKDGTTYYGTDPENPWGSVRHTFWPRCRVNGTLNLGGNHESIGNKLEFKNGSGMYVMALQGMKPHHAAATWNFLDYQSANYSVVVMEFTTPPAYNTTTVSVGMVVDKEGKIVLCTTGNKTKHLDAEKDNESGWMIPKRIEFNLHGLNEEGKTVDVVVSGELAKQSERVDVMHEIPQFVKNIVSGVAGTKPYIFQFSNDLNLKLEIDGVVQDEETGYAYNEATFITEI